MRSRYAGGHAVTLAPALLRPPLQWGMALCHCWLYQLAVRQCALNTPSREDLLLMARSMQIQTV